LGTPWKICAMTEICFGQPHKNLVIRSMVGIEPLSIKQMNFLGSTPNVFGWWPNLFLCDNYKLVIEIFWSPSLVREKLGNWKNLVIRTGQTKIFQSPKKPVNIHLDKWNWHVQANIDMMMDSNWACHTISNHHFWCDMKKLRIFKKRFRVNLKNFLNVNFINIITCIKIIIYIVNIRFQYFLWFKINL
jgi:hypothetical protein